jgi:hypothetical protein
VQDQEKRRAELKCSALSICTVYLFLIYVMRIDRALGRAVGPSFVLFSRLNACIGGRGERVTIRAKSSQSLLCARRMV